MAGIAARTIQISRVTLRALHELTTSPNPIRLCRNVIAKEQQRLKQSPK